MTDDRAVLRGEVLVRVHASPIHPNDIMALVGRSANTRSVRLGLEVKAALPTEGGNDHNRPTHDISG